MTTLLDKGLIVFAESRKLKRKEDQKPFEIITYIAQENLNNHKQSITIKQFKDGHDNILLEKGSYITCRGILYENRYKTPQGDYKSTGFEIRVSESDSDSYLKPVFN